jgi:hypothetical protein
LRFAHWSKLAPCDTCEPCHLKGRETKIAYTDCRRSDDHSRAGVQLQHGWTVSNLGEARRILYCCNRLGWGVLATHWMPCGALYYGTSLDPATFQTEELEVVGRVVQGLVELALDSDICDAVVSRPNLDAMWYS